MSSDAKIYTVKEGDCISQISAENGFFWETLWNLPENKELKDARGDPNILLPGDTLVIPELRQKSETIGTETKHRFIQKGVPAMLRIEIHKHGEVRANEPYKLDIDGKLFEGVLDDKGRLEEPIPPGARKGVLIVGDDEQSMEFVLGSLNPVVEIVGIQMRLNNLGYGSGQNDDELGPVTKAAIRRFQKDHNLTQSGEPDDDTVAKIKEIHGS